MPLFKGKASKDKPEKIINDITKNAEYVGVVNLSEDKDYAEQFWKTATLYFGKNTEPNERKYYHFIFSPDRADNVSPKICQQAAMELAETLFPEFECVVATHTDTDIVHSHMVVNSVNAYTGLKLRILNNAYHSMMDKANEIGARYGMTELDWRSAFKEKREKLAAGEPLPVTQAEKRIIQRGGTSWKEDLRKAIDQALQACDNFLSFQEYLQRSGVTCTQIGTAIAYQHPDKKLPIRGERLGEGYTLTDVMSALEERKTANERKTKGGLCIMPLFKGRSSKAKPDKAIAYITNPNKAKYVGVVNLEEGSDYAEDFWITATLHYGKNTEPNERKYYHFKFSPDRADNVSPEICQQAAMELAETLFSEFECVVATHTDTDTVHSHIVVNSVNAYNGLKLNVTNSAYRSMKDLANTIGARYGMTELDWRHAVEVKREKLAAGEPLPVTQAEKRIALRGEDSWKEELRQVIELALKNCNTLIEFEEYLERYGVTCPRMTENTISFLHPDKERAIRGERLGEKYTMSAIAAVLEAKENKQTEEETLPGEQAAPQALPDERPKPWYSVGIVDEAGLTRFELMQLRQSYVRTIELRLAFRNCAYDAHDFEDFKQRLLDDYGVTLEEKDEGLAVLHPEAHTAVSLGDEYTKEAVLNVIDRQGYRQIGGGGNERAGYVYDPAKAAGGRKEIGGTANAAGYEQRTDAESRGQREVADTDRRNDNSKAAGYTRPDGAFPERPRSGGERDDTRKRQQVR